MDASAERPREETNNTKLIARAQCVPSKAGRVRPGAVHYLQRMTEHLAVQVDCYAGYRGEETPRRLHFGGRTIDVIEVVDRWYGPAYRYFKLRGSDQGVYIVRHEERSGAWELVIYDSDAREGSRLSS